MASQLPQHMRALQLKASPIEKGLKLNPQAPLPKTASSLKKDTVLVKVAYSSLNPVDYKVLESPAGYFLGNVPALDYAGTVVESKVAHLKSGDRVFGQTVMPSFGALADYTVVQKEGLAKAPDGVKLEALSTLGVTGATAWQAVSPNVKSGDHILINGGSGGVGTFAIQFAKALGCTVTAVCSTSNVELCKELGADQVIDYKSVNLINVLKTKKLLYDFVFDTVFYDPALYFESHHYLKENGKFITIAGQTTLAFLRSVLAIFLLPSWLGGGQRAFQFVTLTPSAADLAKIGELVKEGKVKPIIESVLDMEDAAKGYARLKSSRTVGKLVIKINGD